MQEQTCLAPACSRTSRQTYGTSGLKQSIYLFIYLSILNSDSFPSVINRHYSEQDTVIL